ncbi:MAG: ribbon-helix-helix protein, CopG family [Verrucomicrobia bacterium]|nr:ribbon-helix-helix protein, CopG family [Verrucomicrobiota bacterium]MCH8526047.1 ribbon-helix-helix domain-containing protein [Kiritimatiellia bacterium]
MQKIQVLFPDPLMRQLRQTAAREDLPVSEVIRRATELWLERFPAVSSGQQQQVPVVRLGKCKVSAEELKELIYD